MNTIFFDFPIAICIVICLVIASRHSEKMFVLVCQAVSTFGAQFSFGVNISVAKVLPFLLIRAGLKSGDSGLKSYIPFLSYVIVVSFALSFIWNIPAQVSFFYGDGRIYVQLFNLIMLAFAARATALALRDKYSIEYLWHFVTIAIIIHGIASLYQMFAFRNGMPLIGISRPFGQDFEDSMNIAAFVSNLGEVISRPGGFAGEPKAIAVSYGIYITCFIFGGNKLALKWNNFNLTKLGLILSLHGFIAAYSTSAMIAFIPVIVLNILVNGFRKQFKIVFYVFILLIFCIGVWMLLTDVGSLADMLTIFNDRGVDRLNTTDLDIPVAASIDAMIKNPWIAIFGYGMGGSSFLVMEYINQAFSYAYAPNVGIVYFFVEFGLIGTTLFLLPLFASFIQISSNIRNTGNVHATLLVSMSISTSLFCLAGSGIPLGYPLALATSAAALHLSRSVYDPVL